MVNIPVIARESARYVLGDVSDKVAREGGWMFAAQVKWIAATWVIPDGQCHNGGLISLQQSWDADIGCLDVLPFWGSHFHDLLGRGQGVHRQRHDILGCSLPSWKVVRHLGYTPLKQG